MHQGRSDVRFTFTHMTQGQIGRLFAVSSHEIGKWLGQVGLRGDDKKPTDDAHRAGYCRTAPSGQSGYHWVWAVEPTVERLMAAGHAFIADLPEELVESPPLNGPFRLGITNQRQVLNADGSVAASTNSLANAELLLRLLNAAYRYGIHRLMVSHKSGTTESFDKTSDSA